jgi:ceramide glucosyltransferase
MLRVTIAYNILGAIACLSVALLLWQYIVARRFPLHRRSLSPSFAGDVSVLKPLKGCDTETRACLESWFTQDYRGTVQVLFGVHSPDDPVCETVRALLKQYPNVDAQLLICPKLLGPNAKVSTLIQLLPEAKHDVIAISDADVFVPPDFLEQAVTPLECERIGLVNCFYNLRGPSSTRGFLDPNAFAMRCEAFAVNCDFWSQVLQARSIKPIDFALGAAMITTRKNLEEIGGFESLVDYLADDYQLGNRIAKAGREVVISPIVVECRTAPLTATEVWNHQLRWARTIRASQSLPWFFSILNDATLWVALWILIWGMPTTAAFFCVLPFGALRVLGSIVLEKKLTGKLDLATPIFAVLFDFARLFIWAHSFMGNTVSWRGKKYRVLRGGKLVAA